MTKDEKYLNKLLGKNAPPAFKEIQELLVVDTRLQDLMTIINTLELGVLVSLEENILYVGKQTESGNHYIIINLEEQKKFAYAFANQATNKGEVVEDVNVVVIAKLFKERTAKKTEE